MLLPSEGEGERGEGMHPPQLTLRNNCAGHGEDVQQSGGQRRAEEKGWVAVECVLEALELAEWPQLGGASLTLLSSAYAASPTSPSVISPYFNFLYSHALDEQAGQLLRDLHATSPSSPLLPRLERILRGEDVGSLSTRAATLNKEVSSMRRGEVVASPYTSKQQAQAAVVSAFTSALILSPADGGLWHDLGTSLFFAGEKAESEKAYAAGLSFAPSHPALIKEREGAKLYPPVPPAQQRLVSSFSEEHFSSVVLPRGSYSQTSEDISAGAELFGEQPSVFVSKQPLLSAEQCEHAIREAEQWAHRRGGWTTSRQ